MKDIDIIDRKHTTLSPLQRLLVVLALLLVIAIALHVNPALWIWYGGQYRLAIITAAAWPLLCLGTLGLLYPVVSIKRGDMSHRAVRKILITSGCLALLLCGIALVGLPRLLQLHAANPGSTVWFGRVQGISLYAAFTGYAIGLALGSLLALFFNPSVSSTNKDGGSQ